MKRALTNWKKNEAAATIRRSHLVLKVPGLDIKIAPKAKIVARVLPVTPAKSGSAPERNLFRRRIKALFHELNLHEGTHDWIFFAKPGISALSFEQLREIVLQVLRSLSEKPSSTSL
jgi:ribonuclease P protein component